ncbi:hypothetical protein BDV96DRAFT_607484 [Lophiotrema nucula]|uniref:Uncharacterized protein n=1 Tax=Lophiotrema nucula TaxID=690887 RepID=A0A6A5YH08_9PLEO|nr:hypothetical protein BDV96DRAFT_607484 [Lophiotrema nucula]
MTSELAPLDPDRSGNDVNSQSLLSKSEPSMPKSNGKRSPREYAHTIFRHSTQSEHVSLYPGIQYRSIARFLNTPSPSRTQPPIKTDAIFKHCNHEFAVLYDLTYNRKDARYFTSFSRSDAPQQFERYLVPYGHCGARYRVDPEIFRRQLQHGQNCEYFDLPDLPSSSMDIIKLSASTIGSNQVLTITRDEEEGALERHYYSLGQRPDLVGKSIVRQVWTLDAKHFSIEQHIFISVMKREEGWLALILLDHGRDLDEYVVRKRESKQGSSFRKPVSEAHTDYTISYIHRLIKQLLKDKAQSVLSRRFQMLKRSTPMSRAKFRIRLSKTIAIQANGLVKVLS